MSASHPKATELLRSSEMTLRATSGRNVVELRLARQRAKSLRRPAVPGAGLIR